LDRPGREIFAILGHGGAAPGSTLELASRVGVARTQGGAHAGYIPGRATVYR